MQIDNITPNHLLAQAFEAAEQNNPQKSHKLLRQYLLHRHALLWLAKVAADPEEAIAAAELGLKLDPGSDVAQRAVNTVRKRTFMPSEAPPERETLQAAISLTTGMTLTQARSAIWPFKKNESPVNRPIGDALDDGIISLRDLLWASQNAYQIHVKDAAKAILLTRLLDVEPKELPRPLRVVSGGRYTEWQERRSLLFGGMLGGIGMLFFLTTILGSTVEIVSPFLFDVPTWFLLLTVLAMLLAFPLLKLMERYFQQAHQYQMGRWGEEKVADTLRDALNGQWSLFRNIEFPNRKWGDLDMVLVGQGGIWVFEIKAYTGQIRNIGDRWEKKGKWRWYRLSQNPGRQARRNASRLKEYLDHQGVRVAWVQPVVIWSGGQEHWEENKPDTLDVDDPATPVWKLEVLADHLDEIWQGKGLSETQVAQTIAVLNQAIEDAAKA